jgi:hypothetical protein
LLRLAYIFDLNTRNVHRFLLVKNSEIVYILLFKVFEAESVSDLLALDLVKDLDSKGESFVLPFVDRIKKLLF